MKEKKHPVCSECPVHHLCGTRWRDEFGRIDCTARVEEFKNGGGVDVCFFGKVPRKLKYVVEKHKNLFVNPDIARTLVCNEISRL